MHEIIYHESVVKKKSKLGRGYGSSKVRQKKVKRVFIYFSLMSNAFLKYSDGFNFIKVVQRLEFDFPEKDVSLDPIRKESLGLIRYMSRCWNGENII